MRSFAVAYFEQNVWGMPNFAVNCSIFFFIYIFLKNIFQKSNKVYFHVFVIIIKHNKEYFNYYK